MKKTKRFVALIAAMAMTTGAGALTSSADFNHDIRLSDSSHEIKDTTVDNSNLFHTETINGQEVTLKDDGRIPLTVNVDEDGQGGIQYLSEDVWCIEVSAPNCTWDVTNRREIFYRVVKWNPAKQKYGLYVYNDTAPWDTTGQTTIENPCVIHQLPGYGTNTTVKTATFINKSNFQVKLDAFIMDSDYQFANNEYGERTTYPGNNDGFLCKFATKTITSHSFDYSDSIVLNHPLTTGHTSGDNDFDEYLDADETQKGMLDIKLNPEAEFEADSSNRTATVKIVFSKPNSEELLSGSPLYAPVQGMGFYHNSDPAEEFEVVGSVTPDQMVVLMQDNHPRADSDIRVDGYN